MIKEISYRIFGFVFTLCRIFPVSRNKTFLIATHDPGPEGNIAVAARAIAKLNPHMRFYRMTRKDGIRHPVSFFFVKAYHMATSGIILLDNVFMPMAYTPISKRATVIQLWHGTGTIKKFGLDVETGDVARIARRGNERLDWLIVNGERTRRQYACAFGLPADKIRTLGLPRTDLLLNKSYMERKRREFYAHIRDRVPEPEKKRYVLYAPTFRDDETEHPRLEIDLKRLVKSLPEDVVVLLRFHPFVAKKIADDGQISRALSGAGESGVLEMSDYPGVTTLLAVADVLVTDYSSIIFEYALLGRPMVFYAYDLESFIKDGRDFYEPYMDFVPGPVVRDEDGLIRELGVYLGGTEVQDGLSESRMSQVENEIKRFVDENYRRADGRAAERVAALSLRSCTVDVEKPPFFHIEES